MKRERDAPATAGRMPALRLVVVKKGILRRAKALLRMTKKVRTNFVSAGAPLGLQRKVGFLTGIVVVAILFLAGIMPPLWRSLLGIGLAHMRSLSRLARAEWEKCIVRAIRGSDEPSRSKS